MPPKKKKPPAASNNQKRVNAAQRAVVHVVLDDSDEEQFQQNDSPPVATAAAAVSHTGSPSRGGGGSGQTAATGKCTGGRKARPKRKPAPPKKRPAIRKRPRDDSDEHEGEDEQTAPANDQSNAAAAGISDTVGTSSEGASTVHTGRRSSERVTSTPATAAEHQTPTRRESGRGSGAAREAAAQPSALNQRNVATTLGRVLTTAGGVSLGLAGAGAWFVPPPLSATLGVAGTAAVATGTWLTNRLYLADPKARREYRYFVLHHPFSQSLDKFRPTKVRNALRLGGGKHEAVSTLLQFMTEAELRRVFYIQVIGTAPHVASSQSNNASSAPPQQRQSTDASSSVTDGERLPTMCSVRAMVTLYERMDLIALVEWGVLQRQWLYDCFAHECKRLQTFTAVWSYFDGRLPELGALGVTPQPSEKGQLPQGQQKIVLLVHWPTLTKLFFEEYSWVSRTGELLPCAPPGSGTNVPPAAGGEHGVWAAVLVYGKWVRTALGVKKTVLRAIVESCPFAIDRAIPMARCVKDGMIPLAEAGLLSHHWVEQKLVVELRGHTISIHSLDHFEVTIKLSSLLHKKIINAGLVSNLFVCGVPTFADGEHRRPGYDPSLTTKNNIVVFMEYWGGTLSAFPGLVAHSPLRYRMEESASNFKWASSNRVTQQDKARGQQQAITDARQRGGNWQSLQSPCEPVLSDTEFRRELLRLKIDEHCLFCSRVAEDRRTGRDPSKSCVIM